MEMPYGVFYKTVQLPGKHTRTVTSIRRVNANDSKSEAISAIRVARTMLASGKIPPGAYSAVRQSLNKLDRGECEPHFPPGTGT